MSTPNDTEVITALAAVLAIDPRILYEKAGLVVPEVEASPTVEQALASLRPEARSEPAVSSEPVDPLQRSSPMVEDLAEDADVAMPESPERQPDDLSVEAPAPIPPSSPTPPQGPAFLAPRDALAIDPPTPALVEPSYIEDASQRQLYRVRNLATIVVIVGLIVVFIWALTNTLDAVGTWWGDFFSTLRL